MPGKKSPPTIGRPRRRDVFVVVSYDIANNRRRQKVVKIMEGYGRRVQYSVFECRLSPQNYRQLKEKLAAVINSKEDNILFYQLCQGCLQKRDGLGLGRPGHKREHQLV